MANYKLKQNKNRQVAVLVLTGMLLGGMSACKVKYGCPSDGKNIGAERLMSGEKLPKVKKFRS